MIQELLLIILIILIICIIWAFTNRKQTKNKCPIKTNEIKTSETNETKTGDKTGEVKEGNKYRRFRPNKEKFTHIVNGKVDPYTGAIYGRAIYTDQLTDGPATDLKDVIVNSDGTVSSGAKELGATSGNGFDALQQNQTELYEIEKQSVDGVKSKEDMLEISKKTLSSSNNANYNLFNRAGTRPTKLKNDQYGFCAIIDKKYVPYRNRNSQISNVGSAVLVQGYDISEERIGDELENYSFSASQKNANTNGRRKRYITVAGAALESNQVAVDDIMKYNANGNIELKDTVKNVAGENEVIEMETEKPSMNRTGVIVN